MSEAVNRLSWPLKLSSQKIRVGMTRYPDLQPSFKEHEKKFRAITTSRTAQSSFDRIRSKSLGLTVYTLRYLTLQFHFYWFTNQNSIPDFLEKWYNIEYPPICQFARLDCA